MNFSKSILSIAVTSLLFISCKEATTDSSADNQISSSAKKEIVAAVKPETATFHIEGMSCAIGCAKTIQEELTALDGVQTAKVDFDKKLATVTFDKTVQTPENLTKVVQATGDGKTYKVSNMKS